MRNNALILNQKTLAGKGIERRYAALLTTANSLRHLVPARHRIRDWRCDRSVSTAGTFLRMLAPTKRCTSKRPPVANERRCIVDKTELALKLPSLLRKAHDAGFGHGLCGDGKRP